MCKLQNMYSDCVCLPMYRVFSPRYVQIDLQLMPSCTVLLMTIKLSRISWPAWFWTKRQKMWTTANSGCMWWLVHKHLEKQNELWSHEHHERGNHLQDWLSQRWLVFKVKKTSNLCLCDILWDNRWQEIQAPGTESTGAQKVLGTNFEENFSRYFFFQLKLCSSMIKLIVWKKKASPTILPTLMGLQGFTQTVVPWNVFSSCFFWIWRVFTQWSLFELCVISNKASSGLLIRWGCGVHWNKKD